MAEAKRISELTQMTNAQLADGDLLAIYDASSDTTKSVSVAAINYGYACQLRCVKVSLTSAEILTLNSNPITLVGALGAGWVIEPVSIIQPSFS